MSGPDNGLVIGVVASLEDPDLLGRVQVRYPHLNDTPSDWARLVSPMAGKAMGTFFRPQVGDEVLVGHEQNDPRRPYVLGSLWSQVDTPPQSGGSAKDNNWRVIVSRCGNKVIFDDTQGGERIVLVDKDDSRTVVIDSANKKIQVTCTSGDVEVKAQAGSVSVEAKTIHLKATQDMSIEAGATLTIKGLSVAIN